MGKIKIKINLNNEENIYKAIKHENVIIYKDKLCQVIVKLDDNKIIRKNKHYELELTFVEDKLTTNPYFFKKEGMLNLEIYTEKIIRGNKYFKIKYRIIDGEEVTFELEELE